MHSLHWPSGGDCVKAWENDPTSQMLFTSVTLTLQCVLFFCSYWPCRLESQTQDFQTAAYWSTTKVPLTMSPFYIRTMSEMCFSHQRGLHSSSLNVPYADGVVPWCTANFLTVSPQDGGHCLVVSGQRHQWGLRHKTHIFCLCPFTYALTSMWYIPLTLVRPSCWVFCFFLGLSAGSPTSSASSVGTAEGEEGGMLVGDRLSFSNAQHGFSCCGNLPADQIFNILSQEPLQNCMGNHTIASTDKSLILVPQ